MTEEQRYVFDLKGWLLLAGVLDSNLLRDIRQKLEADVRIAGLGRSVYRTSLEAPANELVDHPAIVEILREIIAPDPAPDVYGFRCESSFFVYRGYGQSGFQPAHRGPDEPPLCYQFCNGRIASGLTRVIWELTDVIQSSGGTAILSGSHKAALPLPPVLQKYDARLYEGYVCPAGSAVIMTESCWHYGVEWTDETQRRLAVFNCYNHYLSNFHKPTATPALLAAMPPKRRSAFRDVWGFDSHRGVFNTAAAIDMELPR